MSGYNRIGIGELQQRILRHFFECQDQIPESVNHIASSLGVAQPAVFKSVKLLIDNKYIVKDPEYKSGRKALVVTDKGAAASVALGISYEQLVNYFFKLSNQDTSAAKQLSYFKKLEDMFRIPDKREFLVKKMMEHLLRLDKFDDAGYIKWPLSQGETKLLLAYVAIEYNRAFGKVSTIKEFVDKYGMDKKFLRVMFEKDRKRIDSIIKQLED
jgi:DNA-binding MarR family transcriptional regulator